MFTLGIVIVYFVLGMLFFAAGGLSEAATGAPQLGVIGWLTIALILILALVIIIPSIAVQVRRMHDQDKSGWFVLLGLVPYIGGIVMLVFMCIEGTRGENRYGPDPKGVSNLGDVFS